MNIAEREQQILRVKATSFQPELDEALEQALRSAVLEAVKSTLEAALNQEVKAELAKMGKERPLVRVIFHWAPRLIGFSTVESQSNLMSELNPSMRDGEVGFKPTF